MNIYEFAMNMELDGKKYYEELMNKAQDKGLKSIFQMLANDEAEHHRMINEMKEAEDVGNTSDTLKNANNIFTEMLNSDKKFDLTTSAIEAYSYAIELEDKSIKLYEEHSIKAENSKEKDIFKMLVEEEKKHKLIIENILNFVNEPARNRGVKTVDSDPEFARFEYAD